MATLIQKGRKID